jgi:hypothetical protein
MRAALATTLPGRSLVAHRKPSAAPMIAARDCRPRRRRTLRRTHRRPLRPETDSASERTGRGPRLRPDTSDRLRMAAMTKLAQPLRNRARDVPQSSWATARRLLSHSQGQAPRETLPPELSYVCFSSFRPPFCLNTGTAVPCRAAKRPCGRCRGKTRANRHPRNAIALVRGDLTSACCRSKLRAAS